MSTINPNKAMLQYLQRYAEPEVKLLATWPSTKTYRWVVLVPAYKETKRFLHHALDSAWFKADVLLIVIVNQPDSDTDKHPQQALYDEVMQCGYMQWQVDHLALIEPYKQLDQVDVSNNPKQIQPRATETRRAGERGDILVINRFDQPIPVKQGVGLARKIGADIALSLINQGIITGDWICSTDADALLPSNYFSALSDVPVDAVGGYYAFEHKGDDKAIERATLIYEQSLHYYVAGLRYAGSPYAHYSIGSTLAFKALPYAQVRGFPKRGAGEDFYLLNKLAKLGRLEPIEQATIQLQARLSDRVPFGTGLSTAHIMQLIGRGEVFCYYHPKTFMALKQVLEHFTQLWAMRDQVELWLQVLPCESVNALKQLGLLTFVNKQLNATKRLQFDKQLMDWFDGLKTLQFIHYMRDNSYPNQPLSGNSS